MSQVKPLASTKEAANPPEFGEASINSQSELESSLSRHAEPRPVGPAPRMSVPTEPGKRVCNLESSAIRMTVSGTWPGQFARADPTAARRYTRAGIDFRCGPRRACKRCNHPTPRLGLV